MEYCGSRDTKHNVRCAQRTYENLRVLRVFVVTFLHEHFDIQDKLRWKNSIALPQTILCFSASGTPAKFLSMIRKDSGQSDS
jgi:hypothetical protein